MPQPYRETHPGNCPLIQSRAALTAAACWGSPIGTGPSVNSARRARAFRNGRRDRGGNASSHASMSSSFKASPTPDVAERCCIIVHLDTGIPSDVSRGAEARPWQGDNATLGCCVVNPGFAFGGIPT